MLKSWWTYFKCPGSYYGNETPIPNYILYSKAWTSNALQRERPYDLTVVWHKYCRSARYKSHDAVCDRPSTHPAEQQQRALAKGWPNVSKCDWWSKPHPPAQVQWTRTTTTGGGIVISHPEKINAPLEQRELLLTNHNNILSSTWLIYRGVDGRCSRAVQPTESQSEPTPTRISLEPLVGLGRPNTHTFPLIVRKIRTLLYRSEFRWPTVLKPLCTMHACSTYVAVYVLKNCDLCATI